MITSLSHSPSALSVQDSGVGIPADHLPCIFDRFYGADKSRNRDIAGAGFGLGLAICRWVAEAHGGTIEVSSQVDQGSCFTVSLPIVASAAIAKVERSTPATLKV
ncbi:MAG: HAMP domain-containing histidine kinase [Chloroflexi bacterium]|nr:HAMP domain-containing histidine kinase [Chloroflexota bacterium]